MVGVVSRAETYLDRFGKDLGRGDEAWVEVRSDQDGWRASWVADICWPSCWRSSEEAMRGRCTAR